MATVPTKKKKKNKKSARDAGDAASMLAMHGAKFMSMFDDADDDAAARPRNEKKRKRAMSAGDDDADDDDDDDGGDDGGAKTKTKTKTKTTKGDGDGDDDDAARVRTAARASSSSSTRAKDAAAAAAAVETVVFGGDRPNAHASRSQASASGHVVGVSRAKKLFMSDKVGLVHEVASNPNRGGRPEAAAAAASATTKSGKNSEMDLNSEMGRVEGLTGASLNDMRRKVQNFGAQGLNKWDRRALDARQKTENNQKAERGVRIPMHIGVGMWKKNEEREEAKRQEDFEAGGRLMKKKRGLRKADSAEAKAKEGRDRGLAWGAGSFRGGVLTLKKSDVQKESERLNTKIMLGGGKLAGGDRPRGGGKGGKKSKGGSSSSRGGKRGKR